jgi:hypothetical protein
VSWLDEQLEGDVSVLDMYQGVQKRDLIFHWILQRELDLAVDGVSHLQQLLTGRIRDKENVIDIPLPEYQR